MPKYVVQVARKITALEITKVKIETDHLPKSENFRQLVFDSAEEVEFWEIDETSIEVAWPERYLIEDVDYVEEDDTGNIWMKGI